ncbi:MAG TPA: rhodanese-like domain-containing protein [Herpetosiphonaceae bacterium]
MNPNRPKQARPREIKQRLDAGEDLVLIDVREPEEVRRASIEQAEVYPMSQAAAWIDSLPKDRELVIMCHHGGRSAQVAMALAQRGHSNVTNMSGGIDAWSQEVDSSVPRY